MTTNHNPHQVRNVWEKRQKLLAEYRDHLDSLGDRIPSAAENATSDRFEAEVRNLDATMEEALDNAVRAAALPAAVAAAHDARRGAERRTSDDRHENAARTLADVLDYRALSGGSTSTGGAVLAKGMSEELVPYIDRVSPVAALCTQYTTDDYAYVIPRMSAGMEASIVAPSGTIGTDDPTFAVVDVPIVKTAFRTIAPRELLDDSRPDLKAALAEEHLRAQARTREGFVIAGDSAVTGQPDGVLNSGATASVATAGTPDPDHVLECISDLAEVGLDPAELTIVAHPKTWNAWAATKADSTSNAYVFGPITGEFDRRLFGVPVVLSSQVPTDLGAEEDESAVIVGAWRYAAFVTRMEVEYLASRESRWATDEIDLRSVYRWGFSVIDPNAFRLVTGITY